MDLWIAALVIAGTGVIMHGIFTGLALAATWYFGHVAEIKLLNEAKAIHKEVTEQIKKMNAADAEYDKIDAFLDEQKKMMTGYRSEITRSMAGEIGAILDEKMRQLPQAVGTQTNASTMERLVGVAETVALSMLQGPVE